MKASNSKISQSEEGISDCSVVDTEVVDAGDEESNGEFSMDVSREEGDSAMVSVTRQAGFVHMYSVHSPVLLWTYTPIRTIINN